MGKVESFQQFLATQSVEVEILGFILSLLLATILASILAFIYVRYGSSMSNRRMFARNFVLISMTTMVIITVVKSSLALSLGLVGALSIVRFRAAIKEPEELSYLFLAIAIGLGCGAGQWKITVAGFALVAAMILIIRRSSRKSENKNLHITVSGEGSDRPEVSRIVDVLKRHCRAVELKRMDEGSDHSEAAFLIDVDSFEQLEHARSELLRLDRSVHVTFVDNRGLA
ncbi:MAG: DUF4956 domain-containing protein [Candidatus Zixiibacteriota bacterium]|nr:MAG: DUF4956 domain-containing protein [candidate division Zixibacteria bacterium]